MNLRCAAQSRWRRLSAAPRFRGPDATLRLSPMLLSIVIPIHNEEHSILPLYDPSYGGARAVAAAVRNPVCGRRLQRPQLRAPRQPRGNRWPPEKPSGCAATSGRLPLCRLAFTKPKATSSWPWTETCSTRPRTFRRCSAKIDEGYDIASGWRKNRVDNALRPQAVRPASPTGLWPRPPASTCVISAPLSKPIGPRVLKDVNLYGELHRFIPCAGQLLWGAHRRGAHSEYPPRLQGAVRTTALAAPSG